MKPGIFFKEQKERERRGRLGEGGREAHRPMFVSHPGENRRPMVIRGKKQYTQRLSSVASAGGRPGMGHVAPVDPVHAETQWTGFYLLTGS